MLAGTATSVYAVRDRIAGYAGVAAHGMAAAADQTIAYALALSGSAIIEIALICARIQAPARSLAGAFHFSAKRPQAAPFRS